MVDFKQRVSCQIYPRSFNNPNGLRIDEFLQEMNRATLGREVRAHYPNAITMGVGFGVSAEQANLYKPWLKIKPNYVQINVAEQQVRSDSVLQFYKTLLRFRKRTSELHKGSYRDLLPNHPTVWAYERRLAKVILLILANFLAAAIGELTVSNYGRMSPGLRLFEARIYYA